MLSYLYQHLEQALRHGRRFYQEFVGEPTALAGLRLPRWSSSTGHQRCRP